MPPKPFSLGIPAVYLDTSTLSEVGDVLASTSKANPAFGPLVPWIERVANEANFVLSFVHIEELSHAYAPMGNKLAAWLESMPVVYAKRGQHLRDGQSAHEAARVLGEPSDFTPYAPSLLTAFGLLSPEQTAAWLREGVTLPNLLDRCRQAALDTRTPALEMATVLYHDTRRTDLDDIGPDAVAAERALKLRILIRELAVKEAQLRRLPIGSLQEAFVQRFENDPTSFRSLVSSRLLPKDSESGAGASQLGSRAFEKRFSGEYGDHEHVYIGGVYCDVFTCDRETSTALGDLRPTELGRARQIAQGEYSEPAAFVSALMATV